MKISSTMVMNIKARVLMLHQKYGGVSPAVPLEEMRSVFHTSSLENSPQNWDTDPIYAKVYQQCLMEVLSSDDLGGSFPIVKVMDKVKAAQPKGYNYAVYTSALGQPVRLIQMVPAQKVACPRF